jgi:hypothetical protein
MTTDADILDTLSRLLPAQFETLLLRAAVPLGIVSPAVAPQGTRATELIVWMRQSQAQRDRLLAALAEVRGDGPASTDRGAPPGGARPTAEDGTRTILFLASEPTDAGRLRLGREVEEVRDRLRVEIAQGRLRLDSRWAVRPRDLSQVMHDARPRLVHFSGHGSSDHRLVLEADDGHMTSVAPDALADLFEHFPEVEGVVLNACWSDDQAEALARCVPHVAGMRDAISDRAAIAFASGLYGALAAGRPFPEAFDLGCVELRLLGIPEHLTPVLMSRGAVSERPQAAATRRRPTRPQAKPRRKP